MRVLNKYLDDIPPDAVSIMRPGPYGNPFQIGRDGSRDECLRKYREYMATLERSAGHTSSKKFDDFLQPLLDHDMVCVCKPYLPCHGDILLDIVIRRLLLGDRHDDV